MSEYKLILSVLIFISSGASAQDCHKINDAIKYPPHNAESSQAWVERYYRIPCWYWVRSDTARYEGYKYMYSHRGYYVDNERTIGVILNMKNKRVKKVIKYCFKNGYYVR